MEVMVAKSSGFCFGVNKAVSETFSLLEKIEGQVYTLGPIIHNKQVVDFLTEKGVQVIKSPEDIEKPGTVVIRAHGVTPEVYDALSNKQVEVVDLTCPYVHKIHMLVNEKQEEGYNILIIGDRNHPEVIGINGWCGNKAFIADNLEEIYGIEEVFKKEDKLCVVAQTTITREKWENLNNFLENKFINIIKFDTICNATSLRQNDAAEIAKKVDVMFVVGSTNSSNTQKLFEICSKYCKRTYKIETPGEILPVQIKNYNKIGITAGASTPDWVIKEVLQTMSEFNTPNEEMSFKEAFESSLVTLNTGDIVKGRIIGFNNAEVFVDLGYKSDGIIQMDEFTDDPDFKPEESLVIGDEIQVFVIRVNDGEGNVLLSKKKVDAVKTWDKLEEALENKTPVKVKVVDVVNGGVVATSNGVRIFIPASQIGDRFVKDLSDYLKKVISVRIIEVNKQKRKVVASHRVLAQEERTKVVGEFWEGIEVGKKYSGVVKSFMDFGAFVDIGGVDGLIHLSELSWSKVKHPSQVLKIGDKVDVSILEFDRTKNRISLGFKKLEDNPWFKAEEKFKVGDIIKGKVVRLVPFGAFVELESGIDGLVHISQISNSRIAKPSDVLEVGQQIEAKITEVNIEAKKIGLSIKEVNPIEPTYAEKAETDQGEAKEEIPKEHTEELTNTIGDILATESES